jgi:hypothetical protein
MSFCGGVCSHLEGGRVRSGAVTTAHHERRARGRTLNSAMWLALASLTGGHGRIWAKRAGRNRAIAAGAGRSPPSDGRTIGAASSSQP